VSIDNIRRSLFVILRIYGKIDIHVNIILYGNPIDQNKDIFARRKNQLERHDTY
jgi:hypothetical protein